MYIREKEESTKQDKGSKLFRKTNQPLKTAATRRIFRIGRMAMRIHS